MTPSFSPPPIQIETSEPTNASVIWLHGLGADGHDFEGIVPSLELPMSAAVRFVFPHAPVRPVTINGGARMRAWYDITGIGAEYPQDAEGIHASQTLVEQLIEQEHARGIAYDRIVLAGFSQGGAIALHTALRHPHRLAGVLALSTYLPLSDTLAKEHAAANAKIPIFMAHGLHDPVVDLKFATGSRDKLQVLGYSIQWHTYPMPHSVCAEEISDISSWLNRTLGLRA